MRLKGDDYGVDFHHFETEYDKHLVAVMIDMKETEDYGKFGLDFSKMNETEK